MSDEAKITVPTKEPETPKPGISIKVSAAKTSKPRNFKAEQAKYNAQRQQMLIDAGYTPEAAIAIIRSLNTTYGLQYKDRNECIRLFRNMAERLMYRLENFDRNMSAQIAVTCIGIKDRIRSQKDLNKLTAEESASFVNSTISSSWPKDKNMEMILNCFNWAISSKRSEGLVGRVRLFVDTILDVSMNMVDPFEGMFHVGRLQMPKELKDKIEAARQAKAPQEDCPMCGQRMMYHFKLKKHYCNNKDCSNFSSPKPPRPPRRDGGKPEWKKRREDGEGTPKKDAPKNRRDGFHYKGKGGQKSAVAAFTDRYSKFATAKKQEKAAPPPPPALVKDKDGKMKSFTSGNWDALDALKITASEPTE